MLWIVLIIILTGTDQLSKWYFYTNRLQYDGFVVIKDFFHLTYLENRGAAFGVLQNFRWTFIVFTIVAVSIMIWYFIKNKNVILRISLTLLISGAVGNFVDRLFRGFVVDFLDFYPFGYDFPIFNFADICINVGVFFLIFYVIFIYKEPVANKEELNTAEVTDEQQD
ncbi:MAG TPA: signal peptidase II [Clostridiaceae bacterium]|jgi:signal peptidase II|nr:signal peptidase II [Clostridiaceae bacterium]